MISKGFWRGFNINFEMKRGNAGAEVRDLTSESSAEGLLQRGEAAAILRRRGPNGNAYPFRQLITSHGTHDDALFLQVTIEHALTFADTRENEVGGRGNGFESQGAQFLGEKVLIRWSYSARVRDMWASSFEGGERAGLGDGIDVERLADFFRGR